MEIGELIAAANVADDETKCPFCGQDPHDFEKKEKKKASTVVKSKPRQLGCGTIPGGGTGKWTTAAHHLICAKQCYAMLKPLVRMGSLVGYDVNKPPNGLALPTIKNKYPASRWGGTGAAKKYGELTDKQKNTVSYWAMRQTNKQWHVGHHAFEQQEQWDITEFGDEEEMRHQPAYDNEVLRRLYQLWQYHTEEPVLCDDEEGEEYDLKGDLHDLSKEIEEKVEMFGAGTPWKSYPYFVSKRAEGFAAKAKKNR